MHRTQISGKGSRLLLTSLLAVGLLGLPVQITKDLSLEPASALAKGNDKGNDKGGGKDNDKGGGKGNGGAGSESASAGKSNSAPGQTKTQTEGIDSQMGSLHASKASPVAMANASRNSRVGMLDEYAKAMEEGDIDAAAAALAGAANKQITPEVVAEVNTNMGIEATPEIEAQVADLAEAARTAAASETDEEQTADAETDEQTADAATDEEPADPVTDEQTADAETGEEATDGDGTISSAAEDLIASGN